MSFKEKDVESCSGWLTIGLIGLTGLGFVVLSIGGGGFAGNLMGLAALLCLIVGIPGLYTVNPNEGKVLQFFGEYVGTDKKSGLRWSNPLYSSRSISLRVQNFESSKLKVNDSNGNPIEIAAVFVWNVTDTAQALFEVENYQAFVTIQAEAAIRNLAMSYPYDCHEGSELSLLGSPSQIVDHLQKEIQERVSKTGVQILEARISHLAYSPEIAATMLQRQQASAIVAARQKIVEGAVGMVDTALKALSAGNIVQLDEERKAQMVSNLLVVLCGERSTQPVVNAGTIY